MTTKIGAYPTDDVTAAAAFAGAALVFAFMLWRTARLLVADWTSELRYSATWGAVLGPGGTALIDDRPQGQLYAPAHADVSLRAALRAHRREVPWKAIKPPDETENGCDGSPRPEDVGCVPTSFAAVPIGQPAAPDRAETHSRRGESMRTDGALARQDAPCS